MLKHYYGWVLSNKPCPKIDLFKHFRNADFNYHLNLTLSVCQLQKLHTNTFLVSVLTYSDLS